MRLFTPSPRHFTPRDARGYYISRLWRGALYKRSKFRPARASERGKSIASRIARGNVSRGVKNIARILSNMTKISREFYQIIPPHVISSRAIRPPRVYMNVRSPVRCTGLLICLFQRRARGEIPNVCIMRHAKGVRYNSLVHRTG